MWNPVNAAHIVFGSAAILSWSPYSCLRSWSGRTAASATMSRPVVGTASSAASSPFAFAFRTALACGAHSGPVRLAVADSGCIDAATRACQRPPLFLIRRPLWLLAPNAGWPALSLWRLSPADAPPRARRRQRRARAGGQVVPVRPGSSHAAVW